MNQRLLPPILAAAAMLAACDSTAPEFPPVRLDGTWQASEPGGLESTLVLGSGGAATLVEADFGTEACTYAVGSWSADGSMLSLAVAPRGTSPAAGGRSFTYELGPDSLVLISDDGRTVFRPVRSAPTCVDYGWGTWTGTLRAEVDGEPRTFDEIRVQLAVSSGGLEIRSLWQPCDTCAFEGDELVLRIDAAPESLSTGSYTVQNVPGATRTFYGFHHTHPGDPDFLGFNTDRLLPPGTFDLTAVDVDRIRGTFSFRGNPIVEGQQAPDGRTTILVTGGVVDLEYR